jgi:hypothetical protein
MTDYISNELFHFVGRKAPTDHERNFEVLLKILRSKCISSKPPEVGWGTTSVTLTRGAKLEDEELAVSNITCYCDIPVDLLARHTEKYGCFGLSFDRSLLAQYGARPVLYVPMKSDNWRSPYGATMLRDIEAIFEGFMRHLYDENFPAPNQSTRSVGSIPGNAQQSIQALHGLLLKDFLAYIKPYDSELHVDDLNYFYSEREWRRIGGLMFGYDDIQAIVVRDGFEKRLREALPEFRGRVLTLTD